MTEETHCSNDTEAALRYQERGKGLSFQRSLGAVFGPKRNPEIFQGLAAYSGVLGGEAF